MARSPAAATAREATLTLIDPVPPTVKPGSAEWAEVARQYQIRGRHLGERWREPYRKMIDAMMRRESSG